MEFTQAEYDALPKAENLKEDIKYFPLGFRLKFIGIILKL